MAGNHQENPSFRNNLKIDLDGAIMFDTETGRGDSSVLKDWKKSCENTAMMVLRNDPLNKNAIATHKWSKESKFSEPDMEVIVSTFQAAGLMASSFYASGKK